MVEQVFLKHQCSSELRSYTDPRALEWALGAILPLSHRLDVDLDILEQLKEHRPTFIRSTCGGMTYTVVFKQNRLNLILLSVSHEELWTEDSPFEQAKVAGYRALQDSLKDQCLRVFNTPYRLFDKPFLHFGDDVLII